MKIAMMTNNYKPYIAGVPISVERLSEGLRANGHEVIVFAPDYEGQEEDEHIVRYKAFIKGVLDGFSVPNSLDPDIEKRFREGQFDVIHVHHPMLIGRTALYYLKNIMCRSVSHTIPGTSSIFIISARNFYRRQYRIM